ncbi:hypothetical protein D3C78_1345450 [compost metagenome]
MAFLAGRPGRRPLGTGPERGALPPTKSASLSSAFLARAFVTFSGLSAAAVLVAFLAAVLAAGLATFTAVLAGAFSAAMLTARLAAGALSSAASIAEEDLPVDLVIVASVVVATRLGMLHRASTTPDCGLARRSYG